MNTMTLHLVLGLFIATPIIVLSIYKLDLLSKKFIQARNDRSSFISSAINIFLLLLVPLSLMVIYRLIVSFSLPIASDFAIILFIASSVVVPILLIMHSSSYLAKACSHYVKAGSKVNYKIVIRIYIAISAVLLVIGALIIYLPMLRISHGIPGIVILFGPSMYVANNIILGYFLAFSMKIHQFFFKRH